MPRLADHPTQAPTRFADAPPLTPEQRRFERDRLALLARDGFSGESRWLRDRQGRRTNLIVRGEGPCPTLLVHGGLSQASEWAPLAGRLPGPLVLADRPGCGLSDGVDFRRVDFRRLAVEWLDDVVEGLGAERVDLVGNSIGGFCSAAFALARPERVRRLAFVGAVAGVHDELPLFVRLWGNPVAGQLIMRLRITDPEVFRRRVFGRLLVARAERVPRADLEVMVAAMGLPGIDRASLAMLRTVTTLRGWRRSLMLRDELAGLRAPTLLLWGDADAFAPPSHGRELAARMPDARIRVLEDAGHLPQFDRPDDVAAAIAGFLR